MRIALVKPSMGLQGAQPYRSRAIMEPLVFAVLAGLTPPGHECVFYDERLQSVPTDDHFDLAAITVETYTARRSYELAAAFRRAGTPVVLGGFHPTLCPEEAAQHADAIVIGEAEVIWPAIVHDAQAGQLRLLYRSPGRSSLEMIPVDRTLFRNQRYLPVSLVQYSRGCPHTCDFCAVRSFYGAKLTHRPLDELLRELDTLPTRTVFFIDDNITADRQAARALFAALAARRIRWLSQAGLDVATDPALLDAMAESGCFALIIGLESLNPLNLVQMRKAWANSLGGYAHALNAIKQRGILVYGGFVFGYDNDTPRSVAETVDFALAQKLFLAAFNPLQPYPGTSLYARLQSEGRLLYERWWLDPRYLWERPAFTPVGMTPDELAEACRVARRRFAGIGSIVSRAWDTQAHLKDPFRAAVYCAGNLLSRHDIQRKQGLSLGFSAQVDTSEVMP